MVAGLCTFLMRPARVLKSAIVLKPSTLLRFHQMLVKGKYCALFSPQHRGRPGPKGPNKQLIDAVLDMKRRNGSTLLSTDTLLFFAFAALATMRCSWLPVVDDHLPKLEVAHSIPGKCCPDRLPTES